MFNLQIILHNTPKNPCAFLYIYCIIPHSLMLFAAGRFKAEAISVLFLKEGQSKD